jgi:DNA-binding LacI/PurR family transcriptional regulator
LVKGGNVIGIRDLARHLDISIGTISRALNDKADVNPETRKRVREAAAMLGYSPNQSGRSLRRGKTDLVGVIVPVGSQSVLINTVFLSVLDGLRRKLSESRLDLAVFLQGQDADIFGSLRRLTERGLVDGVIITNTLRVDPRIDYLLERSRPFVAFGRSLSGGSYSWVDPDFEAAVEGAIDLLARNGHKRIGLILPPGETNYLHLIFETYRSSLLKRGLVVDPGYLQRRAVGEGGGYDAGEAMLALRRPPTAILISEAVQAFGLYRKLEEARLKPGRDISVVGLLSEERVQMLSPALTSFTTDWTAIGTRLGEALIDALSASASVRGKPKPTTTKLLTPVTFVDGASVHRVKTSDTKS